jgi:hypothetical protein
VIAEIGKTDNSVRADLAGAADHNATANDAMCTKARAVADLRVSSDHSARTDRHALPDFGRLVHGPILRRKTTFMVRIESCCDRRECPRNIVGSEQLCCAPRRDAGLQPRDAPARIGDDLKRMPATFAKRQMRRARAIQWRNVVDQSGAIE